MFRTPSTSLRGLEDLVAGVDEGGSDNRFPKPFSDACCHCRTRAQRRMYLAEIVIGEVQGNRMVRVRWMLSAVGPGYSETTCLRCWIS